MKFRPDLGHYETHTLPMSTEGYFCDAVARAGNQPPTCVMLIAFASIRPQFFW